MDKKVIFMTIIYVILLIMMYIYSAMMIYDGTSTDKNLSYAFFGFSIIISIMCVISIIKSDSKSPLVKISMGISTFLMFILLISSLVIAKPKSEKYLQIIAYSNISVLFLVNIYATIMLIGKPVIQALFDNTQLTVQ
jgi:hypothetical protein